MNRPANPFAALSSIVAPAILTNGCAVPALSDLQQRVAAARAAAGRRP
jgi:hypothetical protein